MSDGLDEGAGSAFSGDGRSEQLRALAQREFDTLVRTRSYAALAVVFGLVIVGFPLAGGVGGYLPIVIDLLWPVEVLVPVVAFGFGTWSVLADAQRGELEVVRTYPVARGTYVLGVYLGRAVGLLLTILVPLLVVGLAVPLLREPATSVLASHGTVDSPGYFLRFVVITCGYGLVVLALAMAVSVLARSRRSGIAAGALAVLAVVVGFDLALVFGIGHGFVGEDTLALALGVSPPSAFRGLVLASAAGGLVESGPTAASVPASVAGLGGWLLLGLGVAVARVWPSGH
jgi:ABC-type transport system involved in multi-copper enzyme maturation permease subunit